MPLGTPSSFGDIPPHSALASMVGSATVGPTLRDPADNPGAFHGNRQSQGSRTRRGAPEEVHQPSASPGRRHGGGRQEDLRPVVPRLWHQAPGQRRHLHRRGRHLRGAGSPPRAPRTLSGSCNRSGCTEGSGTSCGEPCGWQTDASCRKRWRCWRGCWCWGQFWYRNSCGWRRCCYRRGLNRRPGGHWRHAPRWCAGRRIDRQAGTNEEVVTAEGGAPLCRTLSSRLS